MSGFVSGIVLAAGTASRFGKGPKQLLPWRGMTLLEWVIRQIEASPLEEVIVVVGHEAEEIRRKVSLQRAKFVEAPDFREGCSASIRAGLQAIDPKAQAAVLVLGDQPGIESEIIAAVSERWWQVRTPVVRISYRGQPGHPMVVGKAIFEQVKALHGDKGVWKLLEANPDWVTEVQLDKLYPCNINTLEDYARLVSAPASEARG